LQDLYKWLYYGEFGYEEHISYLKKEKGQQELHKILNDIKYEQNIENLSDLIWKPMGLSQRFVMVFVTQYHKQLCPLNRLVNLIERSPAFQGTRMHFKLGTGCTHGAERKFGHLIDGMFYVKNVICTTNQHSFY
jgi:hypothetical protein